MSTNRTTGRRYHEIADRLIGRKPAEQKKKSLFGVLGKLTMKAAAVN